MQKSNLLKAIETTKTANAILGKAGTEILKTSFNTSKKMASLYKDAGFEAFKIGKSVFQSTLKLTMDTQKEVFATSGKAIKETASAIRESEFKVKVATPKKKTAKKAKAKKQKKEVK